MCGLSVVWFGFLVCVLLFFCLVWFGCDSGVCCRVCKKQVAVIFVCCCFVCDLGVCCVNTNRSIVIFGCCLIWFGFDSGVCCLFCKNR